MKIEKVEYNGIYFDNCAKITFEHERDWCEYNYADFKQLESSALETEFPKNLRFEEVPDAGFRFGFENTMFFIPCYSEQNGYYSSDLDILFNNTKVLNINCPLTGEALDR